MSYVLGVLWSLLVVVVTVVSAVNFDALISRRKMTSNVTFSVTRLSEGSPSPRRVRFVVMQGVMSRAEDVVYWTGPLLRAGVSVNDRVDILACEYTGEAFDYPRVVRQIARRIQKDRNDYDKIVIVGLSMAGMLSSLVLAILRFQYQLPSEKLGAVIVDAPSSWRDFKGGGDIASQVFKIMPFSRGSNVAPGRFFMNLMKGMPKRKNIGDKGNFAVNSGNPRVKTWSQYCDWVIEKARKGLDGHLLSVWRDQLVAMARITIDWRALRGIPVVYIAFSDIDEAMAVEFLGDNVRLFTEAVGPNAVERPVNDTIKQPQAARVWAANGLDGSNLFRFFVVRATHCGWGERPDACRGAVSAAVKHVLA